MGFRSIQTLRDNWSEEIDWDRSLKRHREVFVPDTVEWSGGRPRGDEWRYSPVSFVSPQGWTFKLPCFDKEKGRVLATSTCTALETITMPYAEHAWEVLEIVEAAADRFLAHDDLEIDYSQRKKRKGLKLSDHWEISRVDFARDLVVPKSRDVLREVIARAARSGQEVELYRTSRRLGLTYMGVAGGDRLRIYHKGLETAKKKGLCGPPADYKDVIRVELQIRKGQLAEELRKNVRRLRHGRPQPEPSEHAIPVMRIKPRMKWKHKKAIKLRGPPHRAVQATQEVEAFLADQGQVELLLTHDGVRIPEPRYRP